MDRAAIPCCRPVLRTSHEASSRKLASANRTDIGDLEASGQESSALSKQKELPLAPCFVETEQLVLVHGCRKPVATNLATGAYLVFWFGWPPAGMPGRQWE
jgi:hypothetical protein